MKTEIKHTADYGMFRLVNTNRLVDKNHVKRLKLSISKNNLLDVNPILVNKNMDIIDGQHRLQAAKELKLPIYYIVSDKVEQEDIAILNSNKKLWHVADYVQYHAKNGLVAYKALQVFLRNNSFLPPSSAILIACGDIKPKDVRDGNLKELNLDEADSFMGRLSDIRNHFSEAFSRKFVMALRACEKAKGYDHVRMVEKIALNPRAMKPCTTSKEYVKMLEEIYNYRVQNKVRFW